MKAAYRNVLLACLLFSPFAHGVPQSTPSTGGAPLDEVVIQATRANIVRLAEQVRMAEFRFYQRYNELNTKRDYSVNCRKEAPTSTRFTWDYCRPVFEDEAEQAEGRKFAEFVQSASIGSGGSVAYSSTPGPPASMAISAGRPGFQKNMIEITRKNPDLLELLNEYHALLKTYENAYRVVNGAQSPLPEKQPAADASAPGTRVP